LKGFPGPRGPDPGRARSVAGGLGKNRLAVDRGDERSERGPGALGLSLPARADSPMRPQERDPACPLCGSDELSSAVRRRCVEGSAPAFGREPHELSLCRGCAFLFYAHRPDVDEVAAYLQVALPGPVPDDLLAERVRRVEALAGDAGVRSAEGRLLEVGCGAGELLGALDLPGWRLVGLEPSDAPAAAARARGFEVHPGPLEFNPFPSEVFDVVVCTSFVDYAPDPLVFLGHLERILRPGGRLYLELADAARADELLADGASPRLSFFSSACVRRALASLELAVEGSEASDRAFFHVAATKLEEPGLASFEDGGQTARELEGIRAALARSVSAGHAA